MKRLFLIYLFIVTLTTSGRAQNYQSLKYDLVIEVGKKVDTLRHRGIHQAILYEPNYYMDVADDPEHWSSRAFLMWIEKDILYVQKFVRRWDSTFTKSPFAYNDTGLRKFVMLSYDTFRYAEIRPFTYKATYQNVDYYEAVTETLHTTFTKFIFYSDVSFVTKFIDHLWLKKSSPAFGENLNFQVNRISILNDLIIQCEKILGVF